LVALCLATGPPAARAAGGKTIAKAPSLKLGAVQRGSLYDGAFYSGYSVAYWNAPLLKGDRITIHTAAADGETPPCQILFMPGTDDINVSSTTPVLEPASASRDGSRDVQRFVASATGTYVLAMTNADIFLSAPLQCLDAPAGTPFTFKVTVHRGSGARSGSSGAKGDGRASKQHTYVVEPGESLWVIAQGLVGRPPGIAQIAFEVRRLWRLNATRIGSGSPDLIYPGQELRLP
jgi:nucleoid-associated protein YgaU